MIEVSDHREEVEHIEGRFCLGWLVGPTAFDLIQMYYQYDVMIVPIVLKARLIVDHCPG